MTTNQPRPFTPIERDQIRRVMFLNELATYQILQARQARGAILSPIPTTTH